MNASYTGLFHLSLKKLPIKEHDVRKFITEVEAINWRLRECIRELAATHILGQMHRLRTLEEQKAWKREASFDRIEITAEMDARHLRAGCGSEPFYIKLYNPRWSYTPKENTLEMRVGVERLRMGVLFLQPAPPPQCDSSPRRSPAVGTGLYESGVSRAESQSSEREGFFLFKSVCMVICTTAAKARSRSVFCFNHLLHNKDNSMDYRAKQAV